MLCLCLHDMLKAQFIGKAIETVGGMGGSMRPLQHIMSVAPLHLSLLLNQPLPSTRALCMITTLHIEISSACSLRHWICMCQSYDILNHGHLINSWENCVMTSPVSGHQRPQLGEVH